MRPPAMTMSNDIGRGRTYQAGRQPCDSRTDRVTRLQNLLKACPADLLTRFELATLLEELSRYEEALINWKAVLGCDPNNLQAREGMARCRQQIGRSLQSSL